MRRTRSLKFRSPVVTALVALVMLGFMAPAANANGVIPKPFTMTVSPSTSVAGTSAQFTATFRNWWVQKLGSADLSVPTAYSITGVLTSRGTATVVGNTVRLRSLNLAFLHSFTVKVTASAACSPSTGNIWSAAAKTGASFTGSAFLLVTPPSHRSSAVTGACSLAFIAGRQPADTGPDATISSVASDPEGPPLQVGAYDGASNLLTGGSPISISMAIGNNPSLGVLSGTSPVDTSAGIATFSDLSIDQPGDGYTLVASATGLGSATSDPFHIAGVVQECVPGDPCEGTLSQDGTGASVTAFDDGSAGVLTMSLTPGGIDCDGDGYTEHSSTLTFNVTSTRKKEVTMTFDTGLDSYYVHPDDFQVCFQSDTPFPYLDGDGATTTLGLLPNCFADYESFVSDPVPPCVESRYNIGSVVYVKFLAPAGDPKGRV
jgi:hypothetical protein